MDTPATPPPVEVEEIRVALHALVEALAPDAVHALWDVILAFSEGQPQQT